MLNKEKKGLEGGLATGLFKRGCLTCSRTDSKVKDSNDAEKRITINYRRRGQKPPFSRTRSQKIKGRSRKERVVLLGVSENPKGFLLMSGKKIRKLANLGRGGRNQWPAV